MCIHICFFLIWIHCILKTCQFSISLSSWPNYTTSTVNLFSKYFVFCPFDLPFLLHSWALALSLYLPRVDYLCRLSRCFCVFSSPQKCLNPLTLNVPSPAVQYKNCTIHTLHFKKNNSGHFTDIFGATAG